MKPRLIEAGICVGALASTLLLAVTAMAAPAPASSDIKTSLAGKTIFLDPGHQGTNHTENLTKQVPDGRGGTKDCQTTGMTTIGGVAEHTINWNVSQLVKGGLESLGARVVLSRQDDSGWGGCIDERARAASDSGAQVAVSIHADSTSTGRDATGHGFHLIVPTLPVPDPMVDAVQSGPGRRASELMRDAYLKNGFSPANYAGVVDGIQTRSDVAGPATTTVPLVFVEMGNGANPDEATLLEGQEGQLKHSVAIITGIVEFVLGVGGPEPAARTTTPSTTPTPGPAAPKGTGDSSLSELLTLLLPLIDGVKELLAEQHPG